MGGSFLALFLAPFLRDVTCAFPNMSNDCALPLYLPA